MDRNKPARLLLITNSKEDYATLRGLLSTVNASAMLHWASAPASVKDTLTQGEFDACFLVDTPGAQDEFCLLHKHPESSRLPIILLTDRGPGALDTKARRWGVVDYLDLSQTTPSILERVLRYSLQQSPSLPVNDPFREYFPLSQERYRQIVEMSNEGIWTTDATGHTTFVNVRLTEILGYTPEEMIGHHAMVFVYPEELEKVRVYSERRRAGVADTYETRFCHKNGGAVWAQVSSSPLRDSQGNYAGTIGMITDITQRKEAEQSLRTSEERFRTTLENLIEGCQIIDRNWRYLYVNAAVAQHARKSPEELLGRTMREVYPGIEATEIFVTLRRSMEERIPQEIENLFLYPDGTSAWFQLVIQPVPEGLFILSLDITERKLAEENLRQANLHLEKRVQERTIELEAANKELEAFSYSVSHDLRAPLRAIDGFSRIVVEEFADQLPQEAQEYLHDIQTNARQMGHLVDDLLAFSRISRHPIKVQPVGMKEMVDHCFNELTRVHAEQLVDIHVQDMPTCQADASLLKQVWLNLLSNALKYSAKRSLAVIEVGSHTGNQGTVYFVRDNGVGFDMRYAHKLFGVFQRLHRAEEYEGTGVGLAIVQRIINRHGGTVWAEAEQEKGATFFFTLPDCEVKTS